MDLSNPRVALGVWLAARRLTGKGKLWHALVGALVPVMVISLLFWQIGLNLLSVAQIALAVFPPITAALAITRFSRRTDPINPYDDDDVDLRTYQKEGWEDD